jgi:hypothetical protein
VSAASQGRRRQKQGRSFVKFKSIRTRVLALTAVAAGAVAASLSLTGASAAPANSVAAVAGSGHAFTFGLVPSPGIKSCLPHARGEVAIVPGSLNDLMAVAIHGMPANSDFDLFVIQQPNKPFGVSWYQTDIHADSHGDGFVTVRGIFDVETFSVSPGGTTTFAPTHQYHLGLWFNDPNLPFKLGCEPGATSPIVTPFNGEQHAGIQVLNTAQFPVDAGPLSHVHR